ncbi:hypothetical protein Calag_0628 [Caldisphaera lagunensis DSM 15908]|uniref:Uncharacterized protein n=1 Tax=Caldisphaera lagunensis (strain DSM 15908 / JCM 11604 / ANMR 0165 / IC-154) TaxID=1056495 RepID=L0A914_CALLD|nr:hypothetical protein [Caldisphaera lagunensis]AFZ70383.1 hypothetical protein Calag_0628 [Caldisphaera lagunensis DSM 15908]
MQYNELKNNLIKAIDVAKSMKKPEIEDNILIISDYISRSAGKILYIGLLSSGKKATLLTPTEAVLYSLPYYENFNKTIIFSMNPKDSRSVHAAEVSRVMNLEVEFISPKLDDTLEERLKYLGVKRIFINSEWPIITSSIASLLWIPKDLGERYERIKKEMDNLEGALDWLNEKYKSNIERIKKINEEFAIFYTPSTEAGGIYAYNILQNCAFALPIEFLKNKIKYRKILLTSSVDSSDFKDLIIMFKIDYTGNELIEFNTDPITVGLYSMLFISLISDKLL